MPLHVYVFVCTYFIAILLHLSRLARGKKGEGRMNKPVETLANMHMHLVNRHALELRRQAG